MHVVCSPCVCCPPELPTSCWFSSWSWDFSPRVFRYNVTWPTKNSHFKRHGFYTIFQLFHTPKVFGENWDRPMNLWWAIGFSEKSTIHRQHNFCRSQIQHMGKDWLFWMHGSFSNNYDGENLGYCSSTVPMTDPWDERLYLAIHETLIFPKVNSGKYTSSSHGSNGSVLWRYGIHVWDCYGRNIPAYVQVLVSFIYNHFWVFSFQLVRCKMCKPSLWEMNSKISWLSHTWNQPHLLEVNFLGKCHVI